MLLDEVVATSAAVAATRARGEKIALLAACLRHLQPDEARIGAAYLSGQLTQRQIGVGYASIRDRPPAAATPTLTLTEVDAALEAIGQLSGQASQAERRRQVAALFARATATEQDFLWRLLIGEVRQGALEGILVDAMARASDASVAEVRRAFMLRGDLTSVAATALASGAAGLAAFRLQVGQPLQPMLAQTAPSVSAALERLSNAPSAIEWKLDGVRIQLHLLGDDVRVFTRSLDDITSRVPELVAGARALGANALVLDGEAIALRADGRPHPFQVTGSRLGSKLDIDRMRETLPLTPFFFDVLHVDGQDLLDQPASARHQALAAIARPPLRAPRIVTADPEEAEAFLSDTVSRGHEGVLVKSLESPL